MQWCDTRDMRAFPTAKGRISWGLIFDINEWGLARESSTVSVSEERRKMTVPSSRHSNLNMGSGDANG
eukprot:3320115-Pyramimonas_sp.AAC.1